MNGTISMVSTGILSNVTCIVKGLGKAAATLVCISPLLYKYVTLY